MSHRGSHTGSRSAFTFVRRVVMVTLALTSLAVTSHLAAQADATTCPYGKLKWADFQGPVPPSSPNDAETDGGVNVPSTAAGAAVDNGDGTFTATLANTKTSSFFKKDTSWVRPGAMTAALLEHEQYHMDIYEHWARELEKRLKAVKGTGATAGAAQAAATAEGNKVIQKAIKDCCALQEAYDNETNHGTDAAKQAAWCKKVGDLLTPPKPEGGDKADDRTSGADTDATGENIEIPEGELQDFDCNGIPFFDPFLFGSRLQLPPFGFQGYHMDGQRPLLMPNGPNDQVLLIDPSGTQIWLQGHMRLMIGDEPGQSLRGWVEQVDIDPIALQNSPLLQLMVQRLATGEASIVVDLELTQPLEAATLGWTVPAFVPGQLHFGAAPDGFDPWEDLGHALGGTSGLPNLFGTGPLIPDEPLSIIASDGVPFAFSAMVVGFAQVDVGLFGGTLVPFPNIVVNPLPLDANGAFFISATWPPGVPPGFSTLLQFWIPDVAGPFGWSATNAVSMTTPP